jgi:IS5 family transposase
MRKVIEPQVPLGGTDVGAVEIDPKSRDDIPQILRGLQHIYTTPAIREPVFAILEEVLPQRPAGDGSEPASPDTGRPGMAQWTILVLGTLRLGLNIDYDRLQQLANEHRTLRQILGHGTWADEAYYELQTLKDNVALLTPDVLDRINQEVVRAGHKALKKTRTSP